MMRAMKPRAGEPLWEWMRRLGRSARFLYNRRRERLASACLRCGAPAAGFCLACRALVCERCSVVSIETGDAGVLCVGCVGPSPRRRVLPELRSDRGEIFRSGAGGLAILLVAVAGWSYWQEGWPGPWKVLALLLQPAVTLSLVPLALVVGGLRKALRRAFSALRKL